MIIWDKKQRMGELCSRHHHLRRRRRLVESIDMIFVFAMGGNAVLFAGLIV